MQIDDDKDTTKSDQSDTSFNSSSASEFHSEYEYVQKSRSFTCSEVEHKSVQPKKKARRLSRKARNAKMSNKLLRELQNLSSELNTEKSDSSHVLNDNGSVKGAIVTVKDKPIPNGDNVNASEQSVNADKETGRSTF